MKLRVLLTAVGASIALLGCGPTTESRSLIVPTNFATIQDAVDAANPGDIVLIEPGTYSEEVLIATDSIVIRGMDRNTVVLDGQHRLSNGVYVAANDVRIENLTVHSYTQNGILFSGIDLAERDGNETDDYGTKGNSLVGYEVRWVTAYNNGLYGIYAFASSDGLVADSLVSGHPDSGVYVGQCKPCRAVVQRVTAEFNAIGYYGTNASGDVYVIESEFRNNRLGIAPNSQRAEKLSPQEETVVAGNLVTDNDDPRAPAIPEGFFGGGIVVGGGTKNLVIRNRVSGHSYIGIGVIEFNDFAAENNVVQENLVENNGFDLAFSSGASGSSLGNCFVRNRFTSSFPTNLEILLPCDGASHAIAGALPGSPTAPGDVDYKKIPAPGLQPTMPAKEFSRPAGTTTFSAPNIDLVVVP